MNNLTAFHNQQFGQVRTLVLENEPWFVGKDVAEALGYGDTDQALRKHVDEPDKLTRQINGTGQRRRMTMINESGLYALIFGSKLESAKEFKHWVTSEVLPSIRKTGAYKTDDPDKHTRAEAMLRNSRAREASLWLKLADRVAVPEYKHICESYASNTLAGREVIPLPQSEQYYYSATEIGALMGGIDKKRVGRLANVYGLKTEQYGKWFHDKSPYSVKEVDTFKYNDEAVQRFREILGLSEVDA